MMAMIDVCRAMFIKLVGVKKRSEPKVNIKPIASKIKRTLYRRIKSKIMLDVDLADVVFALACIIISAGSGMHDGVLAGIITMETAGNPPFVHHDNAIADADHFW